jgi:hypothetical protein
MKTKQSFLIAFLLFALLGLAFLGQQNKTETPYVQVQSNPNVHEVELVQQPHDTVRNPYAPPVRHFPQDKYAQLGYLERGSEKAPLFGKPCPTQRRKWLYYASVNGFKLPVEVKGRSCTVAPGCDELASRDEVKVDGHPYTVRLYETDMFEYDPFVER